MKNKIFTAIVLLFSFSLSIQAIANKKNDKKIIINNLTLSSTWVRTAISESIDSPSNT
ncbi:putative exported protein, partial [Yersinia pestis PY-103]